MLQLDPWGYVRSMRVREVHDCCLLIVIYTGTQLPCTLQRARTPLVEVEYICQPPAIYTKGVSYQISRIWRAYVSVRMPVAIFLPWDWQKEISWRERSPRSRKGFTLCHQSSPSAPQKTNPGTFGTNIFYFLILLNWCKIISHEFQGLI